MENLIVLLVFFTFLMILRWLSHSEPVSFDEAFHFFKKVLHTQNPEGKTYLEETGKEILNANLWSCIYTINAKVSRICENDPKRIYSKLEIILDDPYIARRTGEFASYYENYPTIKRYQKIWRTLREKLT